MTAHCHDLSPDGLSSYLSSPPPCTFMAGQSITWHFKSVNKLGLWGLHDRAWIDVIWPGLHKPCCKSKAQTGNVVSCNSCCQFRHYMSPIKSCLSRRQFLFRWPWLAFLQNSFCLVKKQLSGLGTVIHVKPSVYICSKRPPLHVARLTLRVFTRLFRADRRRPVAPVRRVRF